MTERGTALTFGRLAWTRGQGCADLVDILGSGDQFRIEGDLMASCVDGRADGLVVRKLTDFDLLPNFVPVGFEASSVSSVTAAVADGPHSDLAARVAAALSSALGVPGEIATVYRSPDEQEAAHDRLARLCESSPDLGRRTIEGSSAVALVDTLAPDALLVVGAAGGSWLQRQISGPGHRLLVKAPGGVVVVRDAPRRCYQDALDASGIAIGPHMSATDARRLMSHAAVPVADGGQLVGVVRSAVIGAAGPSDTVADLMEVPVSLRVDEPVDAAAEIRDFLGGAPVPVVDRKGRLFGVV